jgi:hypothetical protein
VTVGRQRSDLGRMVRDVAQHTGPMPAESRVPLLHAHRATRDTWRMLEYLEQHLDTERLYQAVLRRHLTQLFRMMLVQLIEAFERFLKELAAVCVDHLAEFVLDKRFDEFQVRGGVLAAHFQAGTLGNALCESDTWLDCKDVNDRFRKILADPFEGPGSFSVFPSANQQPVGERHRYPTLSVLWQLRHSLVHNVGVITPSDAVKLRVLTQESVAAPSVIQPTRQDLRHATRFLNETAESVNQRVGERLAELLTSLRASRGLTFDAQDRADALTRQFNRVLSVAGAAGVLPPA